MNFQENLGSRKSPILCKHLQAIRALQWIYKICKVIQKKKSKMLDHRGSRIVANARLRYFTSLDGLSMDELHHADLITNNIIYSQKKTSSNKILINFAQILCKFVLQIDRSNQWYFYINVKCQSWKIDVKN